MLNSCMPSVIFYASIHVATDLLDGHNNLNGIQAVKSKIVKEVRCRWELLIVISECPQLKRQCLVYTFVGSVTWKQKVSSACNISSQTTHLVEILQQIHYPSFNLGLWKASSGRITSNGLESRRGKSGGRDDGASGCYRTSDCPWLSHCLAYNTACGSEEDCSEHLGVLEKSDGNWLKWWWCLMLHFHDVGGALRLS